MVENKRQDIIVVVRTLISMDAPKDKKEDEKGGCDLDDRSEEVRSRKVNIEIM